MLKKSIIPIKYDPVEGPDIQFHQPLIFMWEGKEYAGVNVGWNRAGDDTHYNIKIMPSNDELYQYMLPSSHLKVLHTHVWRVWDERDDIILKLIELTGGDLKAQGGYCFQHNINEERS